MAEVVSFIEPLKAGDRGRTMSSASVANELISLLNCLRKMDVEGYEIIWADGNVVLKKSETTRNGEPIQAGSSVGIFRVTSVGTDTLTCFSYNISSVGQITVGTTAVIVAKPHTLRSTGWNGQTIDGKLYAYQSNGGKFNYRDVTLKAVPASNFATWDSWVVDSVRREKVWPEYIEGQSLIVAAKSNESPLQGVQWIDCNADARKWTMLTSPISVCIENADGSTTRKRVLIEASQPFT